MRAQKCWNNIIRFLELFASLILASFFTWFTYYYIKCGISHFIDILMIIFFVGITLMSYYQIFPKWFMENLWYCKHCKRIRWVKKIITFNGNNSIKYKTVCSKCDNIMSEWEIKYNSIDDFDEDKMP